jgi:hypothetical protein
VGEVLIDETRRGAGEEKGACWVLSRELRLVAPQYKVAYVIKPWLYNMSLYK